MTLTLEREIAEELRNIEPVRRVVRDYEAVDVFVTLREWTKN